MYVLSKEKCRGNLYTEDLGTQLSLVKVVLK